MKKYIIIALIVIGAPCWPAAPRERVLGELHYDLNEQIAQHVGDVSPASFATLIRELAAGGDMKTVEELIQDRTIKLLNKHNGDPNAALLAAAVNNEPWAIDGLILQFQANVDATDDYGITALMKAAGHGYQAVVAQLLAHRANVDATNNEGRTALIYATAEGRADIVAQLLQANADIDKTVEDGETALMVAAAKGHADIVAQLIQAGANVDAIDTEGRTALWWAAIEGHPEVVAQFFY